MDKKLFYSKTLRWWEPFGGWCDHYRYYKKYIDDVTVVDSGLCNRILHWEVAYHLSKKTNFEYKIILRDYHWPESVLLDIPNTIIDDSLIDGGFNHKISEMYFKHTVSGNNSKVISSKSIYRKFLMQLIENVDEIYQFDHLYSDFGFLYIDDIIDMNPSDRPLIDIKIKYDYIDSYIKDFTKDLVGIHIRRNNGVFKSLIDVESIPVEIRSDFIEHTKRNVTGSRYHFIRDNTYFYIIDEILKINPKERFYISHDLPTELMEYYKTKYGDRVVDRFSMINHISDYLVNETDIDVYWLEWYGNVISNIIDLFGLSYTKFKILHPTSTWSFVSSVYNITPYVFLDDDTIGNECINTLFDEYKKILI
jgi:hypothetical protein